MAKQLDKSQIITGTAITAGQISQSIDALTGSSAYNLTISGSLNLTGSIVTGSISNATTSSYILSSGVDQPFSNITSSGGISASGAITAALVTTSGAITAASVTTTGNISSSGGNLFGNQATLTGRLNTSLIRGETASDTVINIEDNVNVTGDITASGAISGFRRVQSFTNSSPIDTFSLSSSVYLPNTLFTLSLTTEDNDVSFVLPSNYDQIAGMSYDFLVAGTAGSGVTFGLNTIGSVLNGIAICDDGTEDITGNSFTFANTKAIKGTRIHTVTDGTIWHITAFCLCNVADVS